jgi:hypothetical protein
MNDSIISEYPALHNFHCTVKLGYSELGYNELPLIANKYKILVGSSQFNTMPSWL